MCCVYVVMFLIGPRAAGVLWWFLAPDRWDAVWGRLLWPVLGLIFLPWTTLAYTWVGLNGVHGLEWLILAIALLVDLSSHSGGVWGRRRRAYA